MELFYALPENIRDSEIVVDDFERKHILQALRKSRGDIVYITDGEGHLFTTKMISDKPNLKLSILKSELKEPVLNPCALAFGYIRPSRMEFIFEKGTELGVQDFYLIRTRFANYSSENMNRYTKIIRQALKQSQQFYFPKITTFDSLSEFLKMNTDYTHKIAAISAEYPSFYETTAKISCNSTTSFLYIVGPEGGLAEEEVKYLSDSGYQLISLGPNRLRAETAAISGISFIQQYIHQ